MLAIKEQAWRASKELGEIVIVLLLLTYLVGCSSKKSSGPDQSNTDNPMSQLTTDSKEAASKKPGDTSNNDKTKSSETTENQIKVTPESCYTVSFKHKDLSSHRSGEACLHHKNLLTLKHQNINQKSICVRVNGVPVHSSNLEKP